MCVDDFSRYTWIKLINEKPHTLDVLKMVEHCVQQMHSEFKMSLVGSLTYFIVLQVKKLRDIFSKALHVVQAENLRGDIGIWMCKIFCKLIQGRRAKINANFLSLMIIAAYKIREISSNSKKS